MAAVNKYKMSRSLCVGIEALAQEWLKYLRLTAEDSDILSHDPAAPSRDAIIAEVYADPAVQPSFWPSDIVGDNIPIERYDEYLAHANAAILQYTPSQSVKRRVLPDAVVVV